MNKLKEIKNIKNHNDEVVYNISNLVEGFDVCEILVEESLIVAFDKSDCWYDFYFLEWNFSDDNGSYYKEFVRVSGPSSNLRECRHTYFPDDGYVFYLNKERMTAFMKFLEKYYDLD